MITGIGGSSNDPLARDANATLNYICHLNLAKSEGGLIHPIFDFKKGCINGKLVLQNIIGEIGSCQLSAEFYDPSNLDNHWCSWVIQ